MPKKTKLVRPLHDYVLIKLPEEADRTRGGIIIPDASRTRGREGTVLAVGPYVDEKLARGATVQIEHGAAMHACRDGVLVKYEDIQAVL